MASQVTYSSRLGFSFTYDSSDSSGEEKETCAVQESHSLLFDESRYVQVKFKNSKIAPNTIERRSLQRVKAILAGSSEVEEPNETAEYYKKALESNNVLLSHKLLLLFRKPKKAEWPF